MACKHNHQCEICKKDLPESKLFPVALLRNSVLESMLAAYPNMNRNGYLCHEDLRKVRTDHIEKILIQDKGALSELEKEVLESLENQETLVENVNKKFEKTLTFGEKLADKVAHFGGSWRFILLFISIIIIWMAINSIFLLSSFDPYPFILLNLVLSCLAALQAPVIMMSQNRQATKERLRANEDYATNLKAELEIQQLHLKIDLFMKRQWDTLIELQKIQIDLVEDILHGKPRKKDGS